MRKHFWGLIALVLAAGLLPIHALAQTGANGTVRGLVTLEDTGKPVHGVSVTIIQLKLSVITGDDGSYEFKDVPAGIYDVIAHLDRIPDVVQTVQVAAGATVDAGFKLRLRAAGELVTVTATGSEETSLKAISPVTSLDSTDLVEKNTQSLGEALDHELGVAKRTFGPGTSRPILRGFDGNRVTVLQDGNQIGSLGFQSGDHTEPIDVLTLEKVEVVKGPATLLYGSNAIGGVVNAITGHESAHPGTRGFITAVGSTNNYQAGGGAGIEHGTEKWLMWLSGGGQRAGDYDTPIGRITNSFTRQGGGSAGLGYYPGRSFLSFDYTFDKRHYGIPFDPDEENPEVVFLNPRRRSMRLTGGFRDLNSPVGGAQFSLKYNDYRHEEKDVFTQDVHTAFENKTFDYRGVFEERKAGHWSGSFGFSGLHRDYRSFGEEALAPPTVHLGFALFGLQKIDFEHATFQFGGRFEHSDYNPNAILDRPTPNRSFNGFSGSAGMRVGLWKDGAFAVNYSHSYRAPTLEELYNFGPHAGNATFEIGDPDLKRERGDGIDLSVRHASSRLRAEANYFYYHLADFIFLAPTGKIEEGLIEANYAQGTSRYTGAEGRLEIRLNPNLWLVSRADYVNAKLTSTGTALPRIPPLRGVVGIEATYKGFRLHPEVVMSNHQDRLFPTETRTAGYATFNFGGSYMIARQHQAHIFSVNAFNLGDRLYRNHLSFIKEFAPEIGRGVRVSYAVRFF
ncbi:MAG TPA: TonB-dependent receptor [Acidobacteriota bacterium]|jgi:iron complex outermembrane receptor protein|nr:TonB-dependent receptor [Acidobacteriota bacterium]